jgi:hypothetical protein
VRLAVFDSGKLFILGAHSPETSPAVSLFPMMAIFDASGDFVSFVKSALNENGKSLRLTYETGKSSEVGQMSFAPIASDGTQIYMVQKSHYVLQVQDNGTAKSTIKLDDPGEAWLQSSASIRGAYMHVLYIGSGGKTIVARYNLGTGRGSVIFNSAKMAQDPGGVICLDAGGELLLNTSTHIDHYAEK